MSAAPRRRWRMTRRGFLIGAGALGGGLVIGVAAGLPALRLAMADQMAEAFTPRDISADPLLWFGLMPDGRLQLTVTKVEMGQGAHTALAQIVADELDLPWGQVDIVQVGSVGPLTDPYGTSNSNTVSSLFMPLREAAAGMREMLREAAAASLGVAADELRAEAGSFLVAADPARRVSYGELAGAQAEWRAPAEPPAPKDPRDFTLIGQPLPRTDLPAKIRGEAIFGYDARAAGMAYGAAARPPTIGARLRRAGAGTAMQQPGVLKVVIRDGFAGVVASSRAAAAAGVQALELAWDAPQPYSSAAIEAMVQADGPGGSPIQSAGSAWLHLVGPRLVAAEYRTPMAAHAPLEPQAALVDVRPDRVIAQVSTQSAAQVAQSVAAAIGRDPATVSLTPTFLGGGFGRKLVSEAAIEAAILSDAAGLPVHVGWDRTEEFRNGYVRPPTHSLLRGALDAAGRIVAIEHLQASGDVTFGFFPRSFQLLVGSDFGAWRGARIIYNVPNITVSAKRYALPVPTGSWRGLGLLPNTFAVESFLDELAHAAGIDPLAFRLRHLGDDPLGRRMAAVLQRAAERADWGGRRGDGRALGIACCVDVGTVVAEVAEVSAEAGQIRVHNVWAAIDPGLPINPDGVAAQTESAIVMGLSSALKERLTIRDGQIEAGNFDRYPILTMAETPNIEVDVLRSGDMPLGVGEPPIGPIAAAVANALFALTGRRLRELPLSLV